MKFRFCLIVSVFLVFFSGCVLTEESNPLLLDEPAFEYTEPNVRLQKDIVMTFTGDVSFADNWHIMQYCKRNKCTPPDLISDDLLEEIKNADIAHMNNEFCMSTKGRPVGKTYNFRGNPENAKYYSEMGVDFVTLANNHCYDYGPDALIDTMTALTDQGIDHVGAGRDLTEASAPVTYSIEGRTVAVLAATRAEKNVVTPAATESDPGVFWCYEPDALIRAISEADKAADCVVVILHWGTEDSNELEDVQVESAKLYIEAGADLVVGGHAHCLQGIDFYKGVPIIYNLGNFLFSKNTVDTALLKVTVSSDNSLKVQMIPAIQKNCKVFSVSGTEEGKRILDDLRSYSPNVSIDSDGFVTPKS